MKKFSFIFVILFCFVPSSFAQDVLKTKIEEATQDYLSSRFLNATFMFANDKDTIEMGAKGIASLDGQQLKVVQKMPIASATKSITAAAILKLQDKGLLDVQDLAVKYLPENSKIWRDNKNPGWGKEVTIHHLLTHSSGLPDYFTGMKLDIAKPHSEINRDIANFAANSKLSFKPGEKYNYSNTNFVLLGLIIEQISGMPLGEFFEKEFFTPLNMKSTKLLSLEEAVDIQQTPEKTEYPTRFFVIPTGDKPIFKQVKTDFVMVPFADGGMASNNSDLIKWNRALHSGKILSDKSYKLMTARYYEIKNKMGVKNYAGYGLYISELENGEIVYHHEGSALAIRSEAGYLPGRNLYYSVLSNVMNYIPKEQKEKIDMNKPENQLDIHYFLQHIFKAIN